MPNEKQRKENLGQKQLYDDAKVNFDALNDIVSYEPLRQIASQTRKICHVICFVNNREGDVEKSNDFKLLFGRIFYFRPYLANLLPCIVKIAKRTEDQIQVYCNPLFSILLLILM